MLARKRKLHANLDSEEVQTKRICEICLLSFNRNDRLQTHISNNHVQQTCEKCAMQFVNQKELKKHMKKNHGQKQTCTECQLNFKRKHQLKYHILNNHVQKTCEKCAMPFANQIELNKHMKKNHEQNKCKKCSLQFANQIELKKHRLSHLNKTKTRVSEEDELTSNDFPEEDDSSEQTAFNKILLTKTWRIRGKKDPLSLMSSYKKNITHYLIPLLIKNPRKFYIVMEITLVKKNRDGIHQRSTSYFRSSTKTILRSTQINEMLEESSQQINTAFDNFTQKGSGWILDTIDYLKLYSSVYEPIRGKSYIPTPKSIASKKAVLNIQNEDDKCFEYSVIASQHFSLIDKNNGSRPEQYKRWIGKYNFEGCSQPMKLEDINKFEKNNNMAINVYHIKSDGTLITPLRITQQEVRLEEYVNLLLIEHLDRTHYTWIRNFDKLLRYNSHKLQFCPFCCQGFDQRYKKNLSDHLQLCRRYGGQKVLIPSKGKNIIQFNELHKW